MSFLTDEEALDLRINRMIFHVVGKNLDVPILLSEISPLQHVDFFLERIKSSLKGNAFSFLSDSNTERILRIIRNDADHNPECFTEQSKLLASDFQSHHSGGNTSMGCFFLFELISNGKKLYAIIKYDNEDVVRYVLDEKQADNQIPRLERFNESFVRKAEAMQKIALIRLSEQKSGGDIVVRDRSKRTNISRYFKGFLQAKRKNREEELCEKLIDVLKDVFKKNKSILPEGIQKSGVNKIYEVLCRADFKYDAEEPIPLLTSIFGPLDEKPTIEKSFTTISRDHGIDGESFVVIAKDIQKPNRRRIVTAENVVISYNINQRPLITDTDDGKKKITILTAKVIEDDVDTTKNS
ncbi:nucleoid-associated protein [Pantoea agglomerans]|uniref:nucleoid-associated protein n=1 Tax=Enterobacter agglomerans TaxID=549 RepID=UPI003C7E28BB